MLTESEHIKLNMPADEYHAIDALSSSGIKNLLKSPALYKYRKENPMEPTPAMELGTMVHTLILEPHKWVEHKCTTRPQRDNLAKALAIRDKFAKTHIAKEMEGAQTEVTVLGELYDTKCKARLDAYKNNTIYDVKTTSNCDPHKFKWAVRDFGYDIQEMFYLLLLDKVTYVVRNRIGDFSYKILKEYEFKFIAIETTPPYEIRVFELGPDYDATERINKAFETYKNCTLFNDWECDYTKEVITL